MQRCMYEHVLPFANKHGALAQPGEQLVPIRRGKYLIECIGAAEITDSQESSHKVQIVIAQYRIDPSARARPTQNGKGVGPSIDQIAQQQDSITASNKVDRAQEPLQWLKATLNVAYGPGAQGGRSA